eukprot:tig00020554_g10791.t1
MPPMHSDAALRVRGAASSRYDVPVSVRSAASPTMYLGGHGLLGTPAVRRAIGSRLALLTGTQPPPLYGASLAPVTGAYMPHTPRIRQCTTTRTAGTHLRRITGSGSGHVNLSLPRDDCSFVASKKVVFEHVHDAHNGVSSSRKPIILDTPEEIERWRAERRKHWPSESNVERKKHEDENRRARGEIAGERRHQRPPCKYFARGFCKLGAAAASPRPPAAQPGAKPAPPRPPPAPTHPRTLLQKLLSKEIRQEKNYIMQCFRYLVENKFPALPPAAAAAPLAPSL